MLPDWKSSPIITKLEKPILTPSDIPYKSTCVYNAGITKFNGKYVMAFRNDFGEWGKNWGLINIGIATSDDGIHWTPEKEPWFNLRDGGEILRGYDPRLTVIDGVCYICLAVDTKHGLRGGIMKTEDFVNYEMISMSVPDNRNMVLFPEKIGGRYVRLERPMPVYSRGMKDRFDMWLSESPDLEFWGKSRLVLSVEDVPYANNKVGPGAPPVKTEKGWLTAFHAVELDTTRGKHGWEDKWQKVYHTGIALLDLEDPSKVIGYSKSPLIAPELYHECEEGLRTHVVFPGGMILEDSGEVKIYYGAADTVECLATANVDDLIKLCLEGK